MTKLELERQQVQEFGKIVRKALKEILPRLETRLLKLPRTEGGSFLSSGGLVEAQRIVDDIETALSKAGFQTRLVERLKGAERVSSFVREGIERQLDAIGAEYGKIAIPDIRRVMNLSTELLRVRTEQGIAALRGGVVQSVVFGRPISEAVSSAEKALLKIGHDAMTDMVTAQRQYYQAAEDEVSAQVKDILGLEDDDLVYRYEGAPLQDNSHPECIWALEEKPDAPYFTGEERDNFEAGLVPPHNEPRWNCQHEFVLDIEESLRRKEERAK